MNIHGGFRDLSGMRFGRLTAVDTIPEKRSRDNHVIWLCVCDCGQDKEIPSSYLTKGATQSCGCLRRETSRMARNITHGKSYDIEYRIFHSCKWRAKKRGIHFDLRLEDIVIPDVCPLLGVSLFPGRWGTYHPNSPSLDRKKPSIGYTKENSWIISFRANEIKNNASLEELKLLVSNLALYEKVLQ